MVRSRPVVLTGIWLVGGAVAMSVGYGAVRLVGDEVTARSTAPLSDRAVRDALVAATGTAGPTTPATPAPPAGTAPDRSGGGSPTSVPPSRAPSRPAGPSSSRPGAPPAGASPTASQPTPRPASFRLAGGQVAVTCTGDTITLRYAVPADGFQSEVQRPDPRHLEVEFEGARHHSHLSVTCRNGQPVGVAEEESDDDE